MANEPEWTYMSSIALETSGGTVSSSSFSSGDGSSLTSSDHGNWPLCDAVLYVPGFAVALTSWQSINLYRRDMDLLGGSEDQIAPASTFRHKLVGAFPLQFSNATNSSGYVQIDDIPLSQTCIFYIENLSGQDMSSGWGLWIRPKTHVPGA